MDYIEKLKLIIEDDEDLDIDEPDEGPDEEPVEPSVEGESDQITDPKDKYVGTGISTGMDWTGISDPAPGKTLDDLKKVKLPLKNGWSFTEVVSAMKSGMIKNATLYQTKHITPDELIGEQLTVLANIMSKDKGIAPFTTFAFPWLRTAAKRAAGKVGGVSGVPATMKVKCPQCAGKSEYDVMNCPACHGTGFAGKECKGCGGTGFRKGTVCGICDGKGWLASTKPDFLAASKASVSIDTPTPGGEEGGEGESYATQIPDEGQEERLKAGHGQKVQLIKKLFFSDPKPSEMVEGEQTMSQRIGLTEEEKIVLLGSFGINADGSYNLAKKKVYKTDANGKEILDAEGKKIIEEEEYLKPYSAVELAGKIGRPGLPHVSISHIKQSAIEKLQDFIASQGVTGRTYKDYSSSGGGVGKERYELDIGDAIDKLAPNTVREDAIKTVKMIIESLKEMTRLELSAVADRIEVDKFVVLEGRKEYINFVVLNDSFDVVDARDELDDSVLGKMPFEVLTEVKNIAREKTSREYIDEMISRTILECDMVGHVSMNTQPILGQGEVPHLHKSVLNHIKRQFGCTTTEAVQKWGNMTDIEREALKQEAGRRV